MGKWIKSAVFGAAALGGLAFGVGNAAAEALVSPQWLNDQLNGPDLVVIDIRNKIDGGSAKSFAEAHIPGAVYSNYLTAGWRQTVDGIVGKLPEVEELEKLIGGLGVDNDDHVIVVGGGVNPTDFGSAARVYWTFKVLGHDHVSILDGGFKAWRKAGLPTSSGAVTPQPADFKADFKAELLATTADVRAAMESGGTLIDGRPQDQFVGQAKHPKALAAGHIPGAVKRTQFDAFTGNNMVLKSDAELAAFYGEEIGDGAISYCNTGHWAATNWFMLSEVLGKKDVKLYDGSMVEWTADKSLPLDTGAGS